MSSFKTIKTIVLHPRDFFLKNLGLKQTIAKNTFWLSISQFISRFLKLILIIYVARILGVNAYGQFTFALSFVSLFSIFTDLGLSSIITREFSQDKERELQIYSLFSLKIVLALLTLILIIFSSFFITKSPVIRQIIFVLGFYTIISGLSYAFYAFFRARQKMEYESFSVIIQALIVTGAGFFVIFTCPSAINLAWSYFLSGLTGFLFLIFIFYRKAFPIKIAFNTSIWKKYLALSWPLALGAFFSTIYNQTDSVMMGAFGQISQTGLYNASRKIVNVVILPATLISSSFFPVLSQFLKKSKEKLQKSWNYYYKSILFLALPLFVGGMVLAPRIIDYIYDPRYFGSILALRILLLMALIAYLYIPLSQLLIVFNQQKRLFFVAFWAAILNVFLNFLLIPKYSLYGASWATVATVIVNLIFFIILAQKLTYVKLVNKSIIITFVEASLSSLIMYYVIKIPYVFHRNILLIVFVGTIVYLISFFGLRSIFSQFNKAD